jgi:lysophospholipase L1-like esterase
MAGPEIRKLALLAGGIVLGAGLAFALPKLFDGPQPPGVGMMEQPCASQAGLNARSPSVKQFDWAWLCRFRAENAALSGMAPPKVVFIGDSLTSFWEPLDPALFSKSGAVRGIAGQSSSEMLLRFHQDVVSLRPGIVHILAGSNDVGGINGPTSPQAFKDNIRAMTEIAKANGIVVILGAIPPAARIDWQPSVRPARQIIELNKWLRSFSEEEGLIYADYHSALTDTNGAMRAEFSDDGVHPDAAGYAVMRPILEAAIARAESKLQVRP